MPLWAFTVHVTGGQTCPLFCLSLNYALIAHRIAYLYAALLLTNCHKGCIICSLCEQHLRMLRAIHICNAYKLFLLFLPPLLALLCPLIVTLPPQIGFPMQRYRTVGLCSRSLPLQGSLFHTTHSIGILEVIYNWRLNVFPLNSSFSLTV